MTRYHTLHDSYGTRLFVLTGTRLDIYEVISDGMAEVAIHRAILDYFISETSALSQLRNYGYDRV